MGFRRQMGHGLRPEVGEDGGDGDRVGDVGPHEAIGGIGVQFAQRSSDPGIGQQVQHADLVAPRQQFARQGRADEAGAAGQQYQHAQLLSRRGKG